MFLDTLNVSLGPMKVTEYGLEVRFKKHPGIRNFVTSKKSRLKKGYIVEIFEFDFQVLFVGLV